MVKVIKQKTSRKRRLFFVGLPVILLAAVGGVLQLFHLSLQDISSMFQLSASKMSVAKKNPSPPFPNLRGTIYSRDFKELSVSYQLYTIFAHSSKLSDRQEVAAKLSTILNIDQNILANRLKNVQPVIEIAGDLDRQQAAEVENLQLNGIYCKTVEKRFHPFHTLSANFIGFTNKNKGLGGAEALYDPVLQPGSFWNFDLEEIDFEGQETLGNQSTDIILTIDLDLQKQLEHELHNYRKQKGAVRGIALAMDPGTGRVLAMVSQPDFNPNYFWQADFTRLQNPVFTPIFSRNLIAPLLKTASIIYDAGMDTTLLPLTVMAPNNGLTDDKLHEYQKNFALQQSVQWQMIPTSQEEKPEDSDLTTKLSAAQIGIGMATLINSGNRVTPYLLHSIYDHAENRFFHRNRSISTRQRILPPAAGIHLRRQLLHSRYGSEKGFMFVNSNKEITDNDGSSEYLIQEILLAAVPRKIPKIMLLMAIDYGTLYPLLPETEESETQQEELADLGQRLLSMLAGYTTRNYVEEIPKEKNQDNYRRFFISKRLKLPEQKNIALTNTTMPKITGLSLRKGLQLISSYNLKVSIKGSGRIVDQNPASGEPITATDSCELILQSTM